MSLPLQKCVSCHVNPSHFSQYLLSILYGGYCLIFNKHRNNSAIGKDGENAREMSS